MANDDDASVPRRALLHAFAASFAFAGASACSRGTRKHIVPYADQPPEARPGVPVQYASSMVLGGYAIGLVVESHDGRPTKIEGNPEHPASLGGTGVYEQASVLGLYDPNRARALTHEGAPSTWDAVVSALRRPRAPGKEIHFVLEPISSPTLVDLVGRVRAADPGARFWFHAPLASSGAWEATRALFGRPLDARYDLARADVVVSLDCDFLASGPAQLAYARAFADRRRIARPEDAMNRLYVVEPAPTVTGMSADERLRVQSRAVHAVALELLAELAAIVPDAPGALAAAAARARGGPHAKWAAAVARDLASKRGRSAILA